MWVEGHFLRLTHCEERNLAVSFLSFVDQLADRRCHNATCGEQCGREGIGKFLRIADPLHLASVAHPGITLGPVLWPRTCEDELDITITGAEDAPYILSSLL